MPIVHVNLWEGFGKEKTKTLIQEITKVFVDLGIPKKAVEIIVHEIPKTHWGIEGGPASEKFKDISWKDSYEIVDLKWWGIMPDDYSKHLEKRIKEMHDRMAKSKLHSTKKRKYWNCRFEME